MSYMLDITAAIAKLDKWQRAILATSCAESMSPVITRFAQPATRSEFQQGLNVAWISVHERVVDSRIEVARYSLNDLTESTSDDSNLPSYDVMIAISILAYALDVIIDDATTAQSASDACTGARDFYASCDVVLSQAGVLPIVIDPRNPPPSGRLESLQVQLQFCLIEGMRNIAQTQGDAVDQIMTSAKHLGAELDSILPAFAERRGWH